MYTSPRPHLPLPVLFHPNQKPVISTEAAQPHRERRSAETRFLPNLFQATVPLSSNFPKTCQAPNSPNQNKINNIQVAY
jgi:hypothetical protein